MKVYEYGCENKKTLLMFQCSAEPSWMLYASAEALGRNYHVFYAAADGHNPEENGTFTSVEKYVEDAVSYLKSKGITELDAAYGVSMGGSAVMYLLATGMLPVRKAIIDAGITPYPYPLVIRRLIAVKDLVTIRIGTKYRWLAEKAMPPERWTPAGKDPEEHYRKTFEFLAGPGFTSKTIYNVFWSANNWKCPEPVPRVDTEIEYWYGEEEKKARKENLAWAVKHFPQLKPVEFKGFAHAEMVMVQPERFYTEAMRFLKD